MSDFARIPVTVLELDLDTCQNTYGVAPCTAAAGAGNECYNTFKTCQDKMNYVLGTKTYRFVTTGAPFPAGEVMRPYIKDAKFAPTEIDPDTGVARRANVTLTLVDEPVHDAGLDPYVATRAAAAQGTYWTRLLARVHNYSGRWARIKRAYLTGAWSWGDFTTELYIIESIKGPSKGEVVITLKDPVKLADRQKVPLATSGKLAVVFGTNDLQLVMNAGDGPQYAASGYFRHSEQVIRYTHKHVAQGWDFSDSSLDGWGVTNGTLVGGLDAATFTATVADAYLSQTGLGFSGGTNRYVRVRLKQLAAGTWEGRLYYQTGGHGFSASYYKDVSAPAGLAGGDWVYLTFDMHDLTAGGNDWSQNIITGLRLDLVSGAAGSFEIDWVGYGANTVFDADVLVWPDSTYRSQFGTTAVAGKVGDGIQQCQAYIAQTVAAVMQSLLNLSGIENANIDVAGMQAEDNQWLAGRFTITACLSEPEDVTALLGEICQQTGAMLWWSPSAQKVKFKVLAPSSPAASAGKVLNEEAHLILDSVKVDPLDAQRLTMFGVYYDIASATVNRKEAKSFLKGELYIDADAEGENEYGDRRQKILYSRWFGADNEVAMRTLAARKVSHYRDAPLKIDMKVDAKDSAITEGELYDITTDDITDETGAALPVRALIVKRQDNGGDISVTALTTTFGRRYGFIAPAGYPNYGAASEAQRQYAYICDANGLMSDGSGGYLVI